MCAKMRWMLKSSPLLVSLWPFRFIMGPLQHPVRFCIMPLTLYVILPRHRLNLLLVCTHLVHTLYTPPYIGYEINFHRTQTISYNYSLQASIQRLCNFKRGNDNVKYLGVPIPNDLSIVCMKNSLSQRKLMLI